MPSAARRAPPAARCPPGSAGFGVAKRQQGADAERDDGDDGDGSDDHDDNDDDDDDGGAGDGDDDADDDGNDVGDDDNEDGDDGCEVDDDGSRLSHVQTCTMGHPRRYEQHACQSSCWISETRLLVFWRRQQLPSRVPRRLPVCERECRLRMS